MALLVIKLVLTPLLVGGASLVSRRFGPSVGGVLTALPVVTGSVSFYLALEQGPAFASRTAAASLVGLSAVGWFCLAYAYASRRFGWPAALAFGYAGFAAGLVSIVPLGGAPAIVDFAFVVITLAIALRLLPRSAPVRGPDPPSWDIPGRMATATAAVVLVTALATQLGPAASGLLASLPSIFAVMLVFTHRHEGQQAALAIIRGFVMGLVATSLFLAIAADLVVAFGIGSAFGVAALVCLAYQALAMRLLHRQTGVSVGAAAAASIGGRTGTGAPDVALDGPLM